MQDDLIKNLNLTELEVLQIVLEWYTRGYYADILLDEDGFELDEICETLIDNIIRKQSEHK